MGKKGKIKKKRLAQEKRKTRRLPAFVIIRTKARLSHNPNRRNWRTDKLRIEDEG